MEIHNLAGIKIVVSPWICYECQRTDPMAVLVTFGLIPVCDKHAAVINAQLIIKNVQL